MFSTILDRVSGFFDRRLLISVFFPALIFWTLTFVIICATQMDWHVALDIWNKLGLIIQAIILISFFAWISFYSFLLANFRFALLSLYEGYWSTSGLLNNLRVWRRKNWQRRWEQLHKQSQNILNWQGLLRQETQHVEEVPAQLQRRPSVPVMQLVTVDMRQMADAIKKLQRRLHRLEKYEFSTEKKIHELCTLSKDARDLLSEYANQLSNDQKALHTSSGAFYLELVEIVGHIRNILQKWYKEGDELRLRVHLALLIAYPPEDNQIMPTQLGNVLKAAEMYAMTRYQIDANTIWPRLQPLLAQDSVDPLQDARTSLDLMTILSTHLLYIGIPLILWVTFKWSILASYRLIFLIFMLIIIIILAWLCYRNAVQAALDYGAKVKAAFDLSRWKVLQALHLQLPTSLDEERKLWGEVNSFLARGYSTDLQYYRYAQQDPTYLDVPETSLQVYIPNRDLPAYHIVTDDDIVSKTLFEKHIDFEAIKKREDAIGKCTLIALPAQEVVRASVLVDPTCLHDRVALSVNIAFANTLAGNVHIGDTVDCLFMPSSQEKHKPPIPPITFDHLLVLDAQQTPSDGQSETKASLIIVLAVPLARKMEFLNASMQCTAILTRTLPVV